MKNESIKCTIKTCAHHAKDENYCSLDHILVGTHELNPTEKACTDCESFELIEHDHSILLQITIICFIYFVLRL